MLWSQEQFVTKSPVGGDRIKATIIEEAYHVFKIFMAAALYVPHLLAKWLLTAREGSDTM